jgi:hypothetical protein
MEPPVNRLTHLSIARRLVIAAGTMLFAAAIAIDTLPESMTLSLPFRSAVHRALGRLGIQQGDWPLFAPNPRIRTGILVAEVFDHAGNNALWTSTDWSRASVWDKFVGARHLNYTQRVMRDNEACIDLVDYLRRSIPDREPVTAGLRWTEDFQPQASLPIDGPLREISLYHHLQRIVLSPGEPLPSQSEIIWTEKSTFLVKRVYEP